MTFECRKSFEAIIDSTKNTVIRLTIDGITYDSISVITENQRNRWNDPGRSRDVSLAEIFPDFQNRDFQEMHAIDKDSLIRLIDSWINDPSCQIE